MIYIMIDVIKITIIYMFAISSFQHQQQVVTAVERAKQVSMSELNAIIGVSARVYAHNFVDRVDRCFHVVDSNCTNYVNAQGNNAMQLNLLT